MNSNKKFSSYFLSHGTPRIATEEFPPYTTFLENLFDTKPKVIVIFSAHDESESETIQISSVSGQYEMLYDFSNFPPELFEFQYPAHGSPEVAQKVKEAFDKNPELTNLLLDPYFADKIQKAQEGLRKVVGLATLNGIAAPCLSAGINYYDGYRSERLPANLLQAQRDYFGAHTYERLDKSRGEFFHTNWTGRGGDTASTTYDV